MNTPTGTELLVCQDIARRQQMGINKYGTTVEMNPAKLDFWEIALYEELLDAAVYLRRIMEERQNHACRNRENKTVDVDLSQSDAKQ